jgi:hypothetical protein
MRRLDGIEATRHLCSRLAELSFLRLAAMSWTAANSFDPSWRVRCSRI